MRFLTVRIAVSEIQTVFTAVPENLVFPNFFFFRTLAAVMLKIYLILMSEILRGGIRPWSVLARANGRGTSGLLVWTQLRGSSSGRFWWAPRFSRIPVVRHQYRSLMRTLVSSFGSCGSSSIITCSISHVLFHVLYKVLPGFVPTLVICEDIASVVFQLHWRSLTKFPV